MCYESAEVEYVRCSVCDWVYFGKMLVENCPYIDSRKCKKARKEERHIASRMSSLAVPTLSTSFFKNWFSSSHFSHVLVGWKPSRTIHSAILHSGLNRFLFANCILTRIPCNKPKTLHSSMCFQWNFVHYTGGEPWVWDEWVNTEVWVDEHCSCCREYLDWVEIHEKIISELNLQSIQGEYGLSHDIYQTIDFLLLCLDSVSVNSHPLETNTLPNDKYGDT